MVNAVQDCHHNLADVEERIRELLVEAPVLHVDETGMRVIGIRQWLHVASTRFLTWYGHHRKRGYKATEDMQILPKFKGTMVHDFWASYFRYSSRHALCSAHILRELAGITEKYGQKWSAQRHALILESKIDVDGVRESSGALSHEKIAEFEMRYSRIVKEGFAENPVPTVSNMPMKRGRKKPSKARKLLDRCRKYKKQILSFMRDFSIPSSNNQAERDIRMVKLQQKISETVRSDVGAASFCRIWEYIATVKKNDRHVLDSLVGAFDGIPVYPSYA